jgi:RNAse (barnase) inhibitor barstar
MTLAALASLIEENHGGVWFLPTHADPKAVQSAAKRAGFAFFHVEGRNIARKEQLLHHVATVLRFPEHFGDNWDALEECLTDLEWVEAGGYVLYYDHIDAFLAAQPEQFETLVEILRDAVQSWKEDGTPMIVLLSGAKSPKGVPRLKAGGEED